MKDFTTAMLAMTVEQAARTGESVSAWGARHTTWLLVGNAGALVLAIQVLRDQKAGHLAELAYRSGWMFAVGLVLAFIGAVLAYWSVIWTRSLQAQTIEIYHGFAHTAATEEWYRQRNKPIPDAVLEARGKEMAVQAEGISEAMRKMKTGPIRVSMISLALLALSALSFATGVISPLAQMHPSLPETSVAAAATPPPSPAE